MTINSEKQARENVNAVTNQSMKPIKNSKTVRDASKPHNASWLLNVLNPELVSKNSPVDAIELHVEVGAVEHLDLGVAELQ